MRQIYRRAFVGAFAASIGIGIGQAMPFPHAHWAVISTLTLLAPGAGATLHKTVARTLGTLLSMAIVVGLFAVADPQPQVLIPAFLATIALGFALMPFTPYRYAVFFALCLGPAFGVSGLLDPTGIVDLMGYWTFHITLGAVLTMLLMALFRFRDPPGANAEPVSLPEAATHAFRIGLAGILCVLIAAAIERPHYANLMLITVAVLGTQPSFAGARAKAKLRVSGALGGGGLAILYYAFVLDSATSIWSLMSVMFVVIWFCGLIIGLQPISYLGYQAGLVFAWSVADTTTPAGDVWAPLVRTAEVAMGSAALLVAHSVQIPAWLRERMRRLPGNAARPPLPHSSSGASGG